MADYTVRELLEDLKSFDLDAIVKGVDDGSEDKILIINPTPINGHTEWYLGNYDEVDKDNDDWEYFDDEIGFNPYEGCYDFDC